MIKPLFNDKKGNVKTVVITVILTLLILECFVANYMAYLWLATHHISTAKLFSVQANKEFAFEPEKK